MQHVWNDFVTGLQQTSLLEAIAVLFGIASVFFSRAENILVYPAGLINTILYTWFCFSWWNLYAEGSLNFYYTIMSIYGWWAWSKRGKKKVLSMSYCSQKDWLISLIFFSVCFGVLYFILSSYTDSTVPLADSFASATAYTGMWLMTRKKIENWLWWIATNLASIPLYFYKGAVFTSVQYIVFLILAIMGYIAWKKKMQYAKA
jgi:nicotinamide mononucleotide transporter